MLGMPSTSNTPIVHPKIANEVLQDRITLLRETVNPDERIIIALAGVPGSGKSTVTAKLLAGLAREGIDDVAVVPMDGFHHSKATLATFPDPVEAFRRRGKPFTFDAAAFIQAVVKLRAVRVAKADDPSLAIWLPSFDHAIQDPVPRDICIPSTVRVVVIEGNYTLFNHSPWCAMAELAHEKSLAKQRLPKRHVTAGIEATLEAGEKRAEENDLPNGDLIMSSLIGPDMVLEG
ncbi:hypothetical protein LTR85_011672 [Meristemomyces frigidus]|nr:hypothetical protein LTR85_011672 [Meristemomyces frigidus]